MHIIRQIPIEPTQNVALVFISAADPSNTDDQVGDATGLDLGIGSMAVVIGGAFGGNVYRKDNTAATDWTLILDANP